MSRRFHKHEAVRDKKSGAIGTVAVKLSPRRYIVQWQDGTESERFFHDLRFVER